MFKMLWTSEETMYRVYCNGREFGVDYPDRKSAQQAAAAYRDHFPHSRYYIRKIV